MLGERIFESSDHDSDNTESLTSGVENVQSDRQANDKPDHSYPTTHTDVSSQSQAAKDVNPSKPPQNMRLAEHAQQHEHMYAPRHNQNSTEHEHCHVHVPQHNRNPMFRIQEEVGYLQAPATGVVRNHTVIRMDTADTTTQLQEEIRR